MLTHLSCFTGIGGIDLAAEWAGFQTVGQVEYADYPYQVLCKHWPDVPKWRDIKNVDGNDIRTTCGDITLLSGGFPCQPHSRAGKRKGTADDRNLWPELRRIISEVKPKWFLGENVPGLLSSDANRFFGGVLRDLAEMGYNVGWCSYEAARVGAPHRRERVFIVAYSNGRGRVHGESKDLPTEARIQALSELKSGCQDVAYPGSIGHQQQKNEVCTGRDTFISGRQDVPNTHDTCRERSGQNGRMGREWGQENDSSPSERRNNWASEPGICRVVDGIPSRVDRLRALGNAVVPQQIYPILQGIANIENSETHK